MRTQKFRNRPGQITTAVMLSIAMLVIPKAAQAQTCDFVGGPLSGYAPLFVSFTDISSGYPTSMYYRKWFFPGGAPSDAIGVTTVGVWYLSPGTYDVKLEIWGAGEEFLADSETKQLYITVLEPDKDFGDAPDDIPGGIMYRTIHASTGANHKVNENIYLGNTVDMEPDGLPSWSAAGDDNNGSDDEDGVTIPPLIPGTTMPIEVTAFVDMTAVAGGFLHGWIDFSMDGDWDDAGEHVIDGLSITTGTHSININIPPDAVPGDTYARFRLSSRQIIPYDGNAPDGEVEDYKVDIVGTLKWSQIPLKRTEEPYTYSYDGWDEISIYGLWIAADDWFCRDEKPVTDIHWWGSYAEWASVAPPQNAPWGFHIGVWTDKPESPVQPYSRPDRMIWEWRVARSLLNERIVGSDYMPGYMTAPDSCFRYDFIIPHDEWFYQEGDSTVYWLSISALYDVIPDDYRWGWKTREHYFMDDGVRIVLPTEPVGGSEFESGEPFHQGWDMAFQLTTTTYDLPFDFGDLPHPDYPTLISRNGAHHMVWYALHLGYAIDIELDGQPDTQAMGDDNNSDDEDGVNFTSTLVAGQTATADVIASAPGYLNAWIDFTADGDWLDADEQIFTDQLLATGTNVLTFDIPAGAVTGQDVYARFRFCPAPGIPPVGLAIGGEVEDYAVTVEPPTGVERNSQVPEEAALFQNFPNPFNPATTIRFALPVSGRVTLEIFDIAGRLLETIVDEERPAGEYDVQWNAKEATSGIYLCRLKAGEFVEMRKLILQK